jgi:hypothetical protein
VPESGFAEDGDLRGLCGVSRYAELSAAHEFRFRKVKDIGLLRSTITLHNCSLLRTAMVAEYGGNKWQIEMGILIRISMFWIRVI